MLSAFLAHNRKLHFITLGVLVILVVFALLAARFVVLDGWHRVVMLDVGQGDAILVRASGGGEVLIDGGSSPGRLLQELSSVRPFWDRTLETVVMTHPDFDHIGGIFGVVQNFEVERIIFTGVFHDTETYQRLVRALRQEKVSVLRPVPGNKLLMGNKLQVRFLAPQSLEPLREVSSLNSTSIVTEARVGGRRFLLPGDVEAGREKDLVREYDLGSVDFLKLPHHGSKDASSKNFLNEVTPAGAFVSAGLDNPYGHPHPETLDKLAGIPLWRTDKHGTVAIFTDGITAWIKSFK